MALTVTTKDKRPADLAVLQGAYNWDDVTEYAAGGWLPKSKPPGANSNIGIITLWQETMDRVLRWNATTGKVEIYVMSTGAEGAAADHGEFKYLLVRLPS